MKKLVLFVAMMSIATLSGCAMTKRLADKAQYAFDHRTVKTMVGDQDINYAVQKLLDKDAALKKHASIETFTYNQCVLLLGQVDSIALKQHATDVAQSNPDVRNVDNYLVVGKRASLKENTKDALLTAKVKGALAASKGVHVSHIKVATSGRTVYLFGHAKPKVASRAVGIVRSIHGVKDVVSLLGT